MSIQLILTHEIIAIDVEEFEYKYEVLIASKVIQGKIPSYLGGMIEKNSGTLCDVRESFPKEAMVYKKEYTKKDN